MISRLHRALALREGETAPVLLSCLLFWLLMSGYYILRPIRDEMGIAGGQDLLHTLFLVTLAVTALAAPAVGWLVRRFRREVFLPVALRFFALNLVIFYLALRFADPRHPGLVGPGLLRVAERVQPQRAVPVLVLHGRRLRLRAGPPPVRHRGRGRHRGRHLRQRPDHAAGRRPWAGPTCCWWPSC